MGYDMDDKNQAGWTTTVDTHVVSGQDEKEYHQNDGAVHDAVWGDLDGKGPNYRGLGWIRTSVILIKIQIGLGILSMPSFLHTLGLIPGIIVIIGFGVLATWADYIVGQFKIAHPEVYTLADVGELLWGRVGREIMFVGYWLYLVFIAGAGLLGASTSLNALSDHAACTAVFVLVAALFVMCLASIQTLDRISWLTWVGVIGILTSVITLTIGVGVRDRPAAAPKTGPWDKGLTLWSESSFSEMCAAMAAIMFSYAGAPAFFSVVSEMRDSRQFTKSMLACQAVVLSTFTIIGCVVYHYCGIYVSSPALGSAGPVIKKVAYGLALPGLVMTATINTHIAAKLLFVRFLRNSVHLSKNTAKHYICWFSLIFMNGSISFIIAESIPVFNNLLSVIGAFLATPLALTVQGCMYIWDFRRRGDRLTWKTWLLHAFNMFMIIFSLFLIGTGAWASVAAVRKDIIGGNIVQPFSCADNSGYIPAVKSE